jgi:hypothetical protein
MNPFDILIDDIFHAVDFTEKCLVNGKNITCITSAITADSEYTLYGVDEGINFYLMVQAKEYTPKKNDKITYKNKTYKVDIFTLDSAGKTYNVYLKSLSSR